MTFISTRTAALFAASLTLAAAQDPPEVTCGMDYALPGLEYLAAGVDLSTFVAGTGEAVSQMNENVIEKTCKKGHTWMNPHDLKQRVYKIFDQAQPILQDPSSLEDVNMRQTNSMSDVTHAYDTSVSVSAFGAFSASVDSQRKWESVIKKNATLFEDHGSVNAYVAQIDTQTVKPSAELKAAVAKFPKDWKNTENWDAVVTHFQLFGTHYLRKVALGGTFAYSALCNSAYASHTSSSALAIDAGLDYKSQVGIHTGHTSSDSDASYSFYQNCDTRTACLGGGDALADYCSASGGMGRKAIWAAFVLSVNKFPGLINAGYAWTADLFREADANAASGKAAGGEKYNRLMDAGKAYLAWQGVNALRKRFAEAYETLKTYADTPAPSCYVHPVEGDYYFVEGDNGSTSGWTMNHGSKCESYPFPGTPVGQHEVTDFGSARCNLPQDQNDQHAAIAVAQVKANAKLVMDKYATTKAEIESAVQHGQTVDRDFYKLVSEERTLQWRQDLDELAKFVFGALVNSPTQRVSCMGTVDPRPQYYQCETCCWINYTSSNDEYACSESTANYQSDYFECRKQGDNGRYNWCWRPKTVGEARNSVPTKKNVENARRKQRTARFLGKTGLKSAFGVHKLGEDDGVTTYKYCHTGPKGDDIDGIICKPAPQNVPTLLLGDVNTFKARIGLKTVAQEHQVESVFI